VTDAPAAQRPTAGLLPAAAAGTGILVGGAIVATCSVVDQAGPGSLAFMRYLVGFCCLLPPLLLAGPVRFERRDLLPMGLIGIAQFGVLVVLINFALQSIPSARAALIFATMPLMTLVIGAARGLEPLGLAKAAGVLVTIAGVGFALGEKALARGGAADAWVGELAVFASTLCGAACSILYRPYLRKYPPLPVSAFAMLASVLFLAVLAAGEGLFSRPPDFDGAGWLAILLIGASSGVGYYLWLWALGRASPTRVSVFLALSPITATGLGALLLGEAVSALSLIGLACVALGIWLAHRE
jgi:drug/metabolite transporter (DMT)-like permease